MAEYGKAPDVIGRFSPGWTEYMHYLYLPVWMPDQTGLRLPARLLFMAHGLNLICAHEHDVRGNADWLGDHYIYVTARRGYATPGNPLNRPGWHCDGFGTNDINYIWTDRFPTRFAEHAFHDISEDHVRSAEQFEAQVHLNGIHTYADRTILRLDPFVVHSTPVIPAPGGERSFFKISLSRDKYNLRGNSHNYDFEYHWKMWDRAVLRNDPAYAGGDSGPQEVESMS